MNRNNELSLDDLTRIVMWYELLHADDVINDQENPLNTWKLNVDDMKTITKLRAMVLYKQENEEDDDNYDRFRRYF